WLFEGGDDGSEVAALGLQGIVAIGGPAAVAVPPQVDGDHVVASSGHIGGGILPGVPGLAAAVEENDRLMAGVAADGGGDFEAVIAGKILRVHGSFSRCGTGAGGAGGPGLTRRQERSGQY